MSSQSGGLVIICMSCKNWTFLSMTYYPALLRSRDSLRYLYWVIIFLGLSLWEINTRQFFLILFKKRSVMIWQLRSDFNIYPFILQRVQPINFHQGFFSCIEDVITFFLLCYRGINLTSET